MRVVTTGTLAASAKARISRGAGANAPPPT
jgi:hypothetical protein